MYCEQLIICKKPESNLPSVNVRDDAPPTLQLQVQ